MEILSSRQMYDADTATIKSGTEGEVLMETAGRKVAEFVKKEFSKRTTLVLCGPGNNAGDGFVVARHLKESGWNVSLAQMVPTKSYNGDSLKMANLWDGETLPFTKSSLEGIELVIDAIFGIGLVRPISGEAASIITEINETYIDTVSVDIPSGVDSDSGEILGYAINAKNTITFARKKIGHTLYPGRKFCGKIHVVDIGIKDEFIKSGIMENEPALWRNRFPFPKDEQHKYDRGHCVVVGGGIKCAGAATLASVSALTSGAGLVTVACPKNALMVYATKLTSVMNKGVDSLEEFSSFIKNPKINTILVGPGNGLIKKTKVFALEALKLKKNCVLDADAISVFQGATDELCNAIQSPVIMTPHDGEFKRLFNFEGTKIEKALKAAKKSNAVIVYKGADSIIAAPDGRLVINTNAPPTLATAGSGDVLAGIISGILSNNIDAFDAACAGVWLHSEAANMTGYGLISENLPKLIPDVLDKIYRQVL